MKLEGEKKGEKGLSVVMLGKFWRLRMVNETGQTMTYAGGARIAIRCMAWKILTGNLDYGAVIVEDLGFGAGNTIVDDGEVEGAVVDNSSNLYWGVNGTFEILHDLDAAIGVCRLYLEFSDNNGNWVSDRDDFVITDMIQVAVLDIDNSGVDKTRGVNFVL